MHEIRALHDNKQHMQTHFLRTDFVWGSKKMLKINSVYGINTYMLYCIILQPIGPRKLSFSDHKINNKNSKAHSK